MTKRRTNNIIYLILLVTALAFGIEKFTDTDLFYMIPTGNYILKHGFPKTNPFVTTDNLEIVIQNWLYCVIISITHKFAGTVGLYILFILQIYLFLTVLYNTVKQDDPLKSLVITVVAGYTVSYINLRPEIATTTLILLELWAMNKYRQTHRTGYLYLWPVLMLIEINLHATYWIMHYILLLPYFVPCIRPIRNDNLKIKEIKTILPPLLLTIPALFMNPYTTKNITYVFQAMHSPEFKRISTHISELQYGFTGLTANIILIISAVIFAITVYSKKATSTSLYIFVGLFVLAYAKLKWMSLFPIGLAYILNNLTKNKNLTPLCGNILNDRHEYGKTIVTISLIGILCLLLSVTGQSFLPEQYERMQPYVEYIQEQDPDAYVYTVFASNNYLIYNGFKVNHDARPELYAKEITKQKTDILTNLDKILSNTADNNFYEKFIKTENPDYVLTAKRDRTLTLYLNEHPELYERVKHDKNLNLYKRTGD